MGTTSERYLVISADTHAGANIQTYRDYLDAEHQRRFDEWRGGYRNPQRSHIGSKKHKNWDDAERIADMESEGVIGEVIFPNTVPPFFRTSVLICGNPSPEDYPLRLEGIRAHPEWGYTFAGHILPAGVPAPADAPVLGTLADLEEILNRDVLDLVLFAAERERLEDIEQSILLCEERGVAVKVTLNLFPARIAKVSVEEFEGITASAAVRAARVHPSWRVCRARMENRESERCLDRS